MLYICSLASQLLSSPWQLSLNSCCTLRRTDVPVLTLMELPFSSWQLPVAYPRGLSFIHFPTNPDVSCTQAASTGKLELASYRGSGLFIYH